MKHITVKEVRDAIKGLPASAPVKLNIITQTNDETWPITDVTFTAKSVTFIVDTMLFEEDKA